MGKTFSESWHRVAALRVQLRPQVRSFRQWFRGRRWCVLQDPYNNQFFRLEEAAYAFVLRLGPRTSVAEAWRATLEERPEDAPGQQDVVELLAQLYASNLLIADLPADAAALFRRFRKRRSREFRARLLGAMFARFPFWDPDAFLDRLRPVTDRLFSRAGLLLWALVVGWGILSVIGASGELLRYGGRVLDPRNLPWLLLMTAVFKALHELGHMCLCKKYGGEVHRAGILLMVFTPMPFADTTSAWAFRRRGQRVLVGLGGVIVESFLAGLCAVIWATAGQDLVRELAFNGILIGSVSTLIFNLNPLLRFDGYYILSDVAGLPNLSPRSQRYLRFFGERYLFGLRSEKSPASDPGEARALALYGVLSALYRCFLFGSILFFVWNRFLLLGMIMGVICLIGWLVVPSGKFLSYLADSPKLEHQRGRAVGVTLALALLLIGLVRWVPLPNALIEEGVLEARRYSILSLEAGGQLAEVLAEPGEAVAAGQPLLRLEDPVLSLSRREIAAQIAEARARERAALGNDRTAVSVIAGYREALEERAGELEARAAALLVRAPHAGLWAAPELEHGLGRWFSRGATVGQVVDPAGFEFRVRIPAQGAPRLVAAASAPARVRLNGQPANLLEVQERVLVAASPESLEGREDRPDAAPEVPAFEFRGVVAEPADTVLLHGLRGRIRFSLPPQSLWTQGRRWWRHFTEKPVEG